MTLNEYIETLQQFIKAHPEAGDCLVVYAEDDEGNGYGEVVYAPSMGVFDGDEFSYEMDGIPEDHQAIAVCIN